QLLLVAFLAARRSWAFLTSLAFFFRFRSCAHLTLCRSPLPICSPPLRFDFVGAPTSQGVRTSLRSLRSLGVLPPGPPDLTFLLVRGRARARRSACTPRRSRSGTPRAPRPARGDGWPGWWSP